MVGDFEHVALGVVCDLAVALVDHVFPHRVERPELAPLPVAVDADVVHRDLLSEVRDQPGRIGEVFEIRDEERVLAGHVYDAVLYRRGNVCAEEAVRRRKARARSGYFLLQCFIVQVTCCVWGLRRGGSQWCFLSDASSPVPRGGHLFCHSPDGTCVVCSGQCLQFVLAMLSGENMRAIRIFSGIYFADNIITKSVLELAREKGTPTCRLRRSSP